jgi:hypothetical protein
MTEADNLTAELLRELWTISGNTFPDLPIDERIRVIQAAAAGFLMNEPEQARRIPELLVTVMAQEGAD